MASVEIRKVDKYFGSTHILHGVEIDIPDGEFVVLVGPSGCGKSTLLRMVAGLEEITKGEIAIGGRVVNQVPPKDRDIAMVFQNYALYPHMTVKQNMAFSLKLAKAPQATIDERVGRAASILGLESLLDRYPRQLSGGQRQRVAMGRAIVRDPQVFLFDEPLSNLDAKLRVQMRTEIKELHQRLKTTAIYVTHDQIEAMTMADRIVVMQHGVVEQLGAPLELYDRPVNLFVAGFIGSPAMNFIEAKVERGNGRPVAVAVDGTHLPLPAGAEVREAAEIVYGIRPEHLTLRDGRAAFRGGRRGRAHRGRDPSRHACRRHGVQGGVPRAAPARAWRAHRPGAAARSGARIRPGQRPPPDPLTAGPQGRSAMPAQPIDCECFLTSKPLRDRLSCAEHCARARSGSVMARNDEARAKVLARLRGRMDRLEALLAAANGQPSSRNPAPRPSAITLPAVLDAHRLVPKRRRPRQRRHASA